MIAAVILKNLLTEFGTSVGIPDLQLDEENRCNLIFDEIAMSFELGPSEESVYLYSYLGDAIHTDLEDLYATLLDANYIFRGTQGATIGVESTSRKVVLIREERLSNLQLPRFRLLVEEFVNLAELWMKKLANFSVETEDDANSFMRNETPGMKV